MGKQWHLFCNNTFHFTENMRSSDPEFSQWLLKIGNGSIPNPVQLDSAKINIVHTPDQAVTNIFGTYIDETNINSIVKNIILSPTNINVAKLNAQVLMLIRGPNYLKRSIDIGGTSDADEHLPVEFLNTLTPPGMPPHALNIKVNGIYMLLRNMNIEKGLCNGSRFIVKQVKANTLVCRLIHDDPMKNEYIFILPRITCTPPKYYAFQFKRKQFPIRPAFVMTINKAQGGTFFKEAIDVTDPVFSHGQLYVALSRVSKYSALTIMTPEGQYTTKNVVFPGVFKEGYVQTDVQERAPHPNIPSRMIIENENDLQISGDDDNFENNHAHICFLVDDDGEPLVDEELQDGSMVHPRSQSFYNNNEDFDDWPVPLLPESNPLDLNVMQDSFGSVNAEDTLLFDDD